LTLPTKRLDTITRENIRRILNLYGETGGVPGATLDDQAEHLVHVITGCPATAWKPEKLKKLKARVISLL
jgi:hypothetical protein